MQNNVLNHEQTWVLLHHIEGPINLGQICRAMANTGFSKLRYSGSLDETAPMARRFAVHAGPLLDGAERCDDLNALTAGMDVVFGFTPRSPWRDGRDLSFSKWLDLMVKLTLSGSAIGLLFGNEAHGLTNEDLAQCHYRVSLPSHAAYRSMNLAQAVMVTLWELHRQSGEAHTNEPVEFAQATPEEKRHLLGKVRRFMDEMAFLDPQEPERLWLEFVPIFNTRSWSKREMQLLLGLFSKGGSRYRALRKQLESSAAEDNKPSD